MRRLIPLLLLGSLAAPAGAAESVPLYTNEDLLARFGPPTEPDVPAHVANAPPADPRLLERLLAREDARTEAEHRRRIERRAADRPARSARRDGPYGWTYPGLRYPWPRPARERRPRPEPAPCIFSPHCGDGRDAVPGPPAQKKGRNVGSGPR